MDISSKKFVTYMNDKNNCWLDSSLSLITFNKTFKKIVNKFYKSQINYIIAKHAEAITILNDPDTNIEDSINLSRSILVKIQQSTLQYLQKFSNFKEGEPDSAFCALLNLILQDKSSIKEQLCASWSWIKQCANCGNSSKYDPPMKPIITLPKVKHFQPECPVSFYTCSCKTEQEMKLLYKLLPCCLIFHFENGAGDGEKYPLFFSVEARKYHLTAVVVFEKSGDPNFNHFVTYIRESSLNLWLDCNDLNPTIVSFSSKQPEFALKDVCMYVYEAFDNLGKISFEVPTEISTDIDKNMKNCHVECIDLVNEGEEVKQPLGKVGDKDNSSNLYPSVRKKKSLLNFEKKLAEESLSINNIMRPVISKDSDKPDINCSMLHNSNKISFQKGEAKDSLDSVLHAESCVNEEDFIYESKNIKIKENFCNISSEKNINTSGDNENEDQNDLHSLTEMSADKINSVKRKASPMNLSSKADCHAGTSKSKNVKSEKTHESRELSLSPDRIRRRQKFTNETSCDTDQSVDAKVKKIVDDVVPRTVAAFVEQLLLRTGTPK